MRVHGRSLHSVASFIGPFLLTLAAVTAGLRAGIVRGPGTRHGDGPERGDHGERCRHHYQ